MQQRELGRVCGGEGGLLSFRIKDPLSAINASQVFSPTVALTGFDASNLFIGMIVLKGSTCVSL